MNFNDLVNKLAGELPDGYSVEISLERGSGSVYTLDRHGRQNDFHSDEGDLEHSALAALAWAKDEAAAGSEQWK